MKDFKVLKVITYCCAIILLLNAQLCAQSIVASGYSFSASSKTYSYLSGGTPVTAVEVDDAYTTIPIGFTFRFCGVNYTDVTVCSNGWLRFGTGPGTSTANWNYNATPNSGIEPAVYALYEDVSGQGGTSTSLVTGTAPNRIFKWECRDWLWDYAASSASVSFQVWLYEGTGVIECLYKQETGSVSLGSSGGATIGIGSSSTDWQVLNGVGTNPTSSSSTYTANLSAVPATGQSYKWDPGAPCSMPSGLVVNLVNSTFVDFSWNASSATVGYEYVIDLNSGAPAATASTVSTTNTTSSESGLTPSTLYYIHLRNKCGTNNYSPWLTLPFNTLPPCIIAVPPGIQIPFVDSNSATVTWQTVGTGIEYEYIVKEDKSFPGSGSTVVKTTSNVVNLTSLQSGKTYYVFLRVKCQGNDSSSWILDSLYVPIPCRAPQVKLNNLNSSRVVAYWDPPITSYEYEILNSSSVLSPPFSGIPLTANSYLFSFLDEASIYYIYARSYCEDKTVKTVSDWSSITYSTWALGVNDVSFEEGLLNVYPNPVEREMTVSIKGDIGKNSKINISDITGRLLSTQSVEGNKTTVSVDDLQPGTYMLQFIDGNRREQVKFTKL